MFVYLSKKIAIPHQLQLEVVAWNTAQGLIACGGERGLLKVLKLESPSDANKNNPPMPGGSNLSMNQTLEGHQGNIMVATWNENFRKLTTSDQHGLIIVWMLHRGIWFEEMINNRNRSVVRDMKWTADGQKICIIYEDGAVIVGTVDGQRLWGKEINKVSLAFVEWSPDGKLILFCTLSGEVHVYDNEGVYSHRVPIHCLDENGEGGTRIAGLHWYEGTRDQWSQLPTLCIGFESGRVQLMRLNTDDRPVLIDTQMRCTGLRWDPSGQTVAIAGMEPSDKGDQGVVQFYAPSGQHLRTLRVPGTSLKALSWEGDGLRLALAVDCHIFFANIRPDYPWGHFSNTLVYAALSPRKERTEHAVYFWDLQSDEKYTKYIKNVMGIKAADEYCVLSAKHDDQASPWILIVCNDIGSPVESRSINIEPLHMAMTAQHVVAASEDVVYVWSYRSGLAKTPGDSMYVGKAASRRVVEYMFHVDVSLVGGAACDRESFVPNTSIGQPQDPIASIDANSQCLVVARESGVVQRYSLPHLMLEAKFVIKCRPQVVSLNCDATRMSVIDISGILTLYDIEVDNRGGTEGHVGKQLDLERKDVWNTKWADDNAELFAILEKTRMYVVRGLELEEPVLSSAYICQFNDLQIRSVLVDDVVRNPDTPRKDAILDFETKSLRDTRDILNKVVNLKDALNYVEQNPHKRLWRLVADSALDHLDFATAEKAFVKYQNYQGICFVKKLKKLDDPNKQKAEVAIYHQRFDEAEKIYRDINRVDLAVELRERLGDWFRVIQLTSTPDGEDDAQLARAYSEVGDYYADRGKWPHAAKYYSHANNNEKLVKALYILEDYETLNSLVSKLEDKDPLLVEIGHRFASVGLCVEAHNAFLRGGDIVAAVDTCVLLNQWALAVELANKHNFPQTESLLSKNASHLLDRNKQVEAVELYRKANRHTEAAKLLVDIAKARGPVAKEPQLHKRLYLLAALEMEKYKNKMVPQLDGTQATVQTTLNSLITQDQSTMSSGGLDKPWRGAEACHMYMTAQRFLNEGRFEPAMCAALRCSDYEDILDTLSIYSLLALATYRHKFYLQCSKAFIRLEAAKDIPEDQRKKFGRLAVQIFKKHTPRDPSARILDCPKCKQSMQEWQMSCNHCYYKLPFCIISGRPIFSPTRAQVGHTQDPEVTTCRGCRRRYYLSEVGSMHNCPLCHTAVQPAR